MKASPRLSAVWRATSVLMMLALAACGGTSAGTTDAGTTSSAATASTAASAEATTASAAAEAPQNDAELSVSLDADPPKLDPSQSTALVDRQVLHNICDKLVDLDAAGKVVPMLASEWQISEDGKEYTFTLEEGVTFHDGTPFNAEAVKFNFERNMVEGSPRRAELVSVESVEAVDPQTVKVTLNEPFAPFLSILADRSGMMVSPTAAEELGADFLTRPVCAGPFKYQDRVKGSTVTLVRNEDYWREGLPKASTITYKVFTDANTALVNLRSGQVDMTTVLPSKEVPGLQSDPSFKVVNEQGFGYQGIWLNTKAAPFDNPAVRKAVDLLIDRDALVKVVFGETAVPGHSPFSKTHFAYGDTDSYEKPNVEAAKQLLAGAGVSNVSFTLKTATSATNAQVAQLVQTFLKQGGINMEIEKVEFGTLLEQAGSGNFQAIQLGWSGRPDPDQNIYNFLFTGNTNNYSGYSNPEVDEKLTQARASTDEAERKRLYDEVMAIVHEEVPYVYLWHQNNVFGMRANVAGFTYVPDGIIRLAEVTKQ